MEAQALAGAAVEAGSPLFKIADLSVVNVVAEVPERALPLLRVGERATITLAAYPTLRFERRVERLRDQLDPTTRTVKAIIHVANADPALRPGMFATVTLSAPGGSAPATAGEVDNGRFDDAGVPSPSEVLTDQVFSTVSTGASATCGLNVSGKAYCWGSNAEGALGTGDTVSRNVPVAVATDQVFSYLAVGYSDACGLTTTGEV